jgi:hypothetical protein
VSAFACPRIAVSAFTRGTETLGGTRERGDNRYERLDGRTKQEASEETEYMWDSTDEEDGEDTREATYIWDSMDDQDREDTMDSLKQTRHPRRVLGI